MKPTAFLATLTLTTSTYAAILPAQPFRPRNAPAHHYRLLHTLTPPLPAPGQGRMLSFSQAQEAQSTRGGAVLALPPVGAQPPSSPPAVTTVEGTWRVPQADAPTSGPTANNSVGVYAASFWIGLSAAAPCSAASTTLRAGVDVFWDGTFGGEQSPFAWYQFPGQATSTGMGNFSVAAGDLVRFELRAEDAGRWVEVAVENFGAGPATDGREEGDDAASGDVGLLVPRQRASQRFELGDAASASTSAADCGRRVSWLVEDFPLAGLPDVPVALANFTSVTFEDAAVTSADGQVRDVSEAEVMDIRLDAQGGRLTECELMGEGRLRCARVVGEDE
ncbi:Aspergillopepsin-2 [Madurella mycetomatis]|uniref:Aspergillopepsin-2 n=1 Tax=Madurella mycetomatis TaxID=100816 RepID=A0A175VZG1_9PEZI|nr:Aspergillopepsin-2 [Madurella mycetomatis]KXX76868.1 Aspergillopepsin-2 [Madurella mycetomatis]KXX77739.1 Aspergillopepsin-2 [Madurella mycetomatis]